MPSDYGEPDTTGMAVTRRGQRGDRGARLVAEDVAFDPGRHLRHRRVRHPLHQRRVAAPDLGVEGGHRVGRTPETLDAPPGDDRAVGQRAGGRRETTVAGHSFSARRIAEADGLGGALSVLSLTIDAGRVVAVDIVRNPDKLRHVAAPGA
jgi:hypothetical protein